jgi:hypothetical protein
MRRLLGKKSTPDPVVDFINNFGKSPDLPSLLREMCLAYKKDIHKVFKEADIKAWTKSRILNKPDHPIEKEKVICLGLAMHLARPDMDLLLKSAGYALTDNRIEDVIIAYCLEKGYYKASTIDEYLVSQNKKPLFSAA